MVRLDRNTFQKAVNTGKGRALAHVKAYGDFGLQDLILHACTTNRPHDPQSETNRGLWLYEILKISENLDFYLGPIVDAFRQANADDIEQIALLLVAMAKDGMAIAREALYLRFDMDMEARYYLSDYLMLLDGYEGLEHAVIGLGEALALNTDQHESTVFLQSAYERLGQDRVLRGLRDSAETNPLIQAYLERVNSCNGGLWPQPSSPTLPPFETIAAFIDAVETDPISVRFMAGHWMSQNASQNDAERVLSAFNNATDPEAKARLMKFFSDRPLPHLAPSVFDAALSENTRLCFAAVQALSHSENPDVRTFALPFIAEGKSTYLRLLSKTYVDGDLCLFTPHLATLTDEHVIHDTGLDIVNFCDAVPHPDTVEPLLWVYEQTPCSLCRNFSVTKLKKIHSLPEALAREMVDDCTHERFET